MLKLITVIGARPQIIKASALSRTIRNKYKGQIREILIHSGQHYDHQMSQTFVDQLGFEKIDYNLGIASIAGSNQMEEMSRKLVALISKEGADCVVVYGDTNTTLAAALATSKLNIPLAHIEAGMRSADKNMPEEINRVKTDKLSSFLFCATENAFNNLLNEGYTYSSKNKIGVKNPLNIVVGDVMLDNALFFSEAAKNTSTILQDLNLQEKAFALLTIHRAANTDDAGRLSNILNSVLNNSEKYDLISVFPIHPRTLQVLKDKLPALYERIQKHPLVKLTAPLNYYDILILERNARFVLTDSGGVQKEAAFFNTPSMVFRNETEWQELVDCGMVILVDDSLERISGAFDLLMVERPELPISLYGDGDTAERICEILLKFL